jgi:hypothetical protein
VPAAILALALGLGVVRFNVSGEFQDRRTLMAVGGFGLVFAGLAYSLPLLGITVPTAFRLEFVSGPGIAIFLACGVMLAASCAADRFRTLATVLLAGWVVAVGTGRTLSLQRDWETLSFYPRQMHVLGRLVRLVPDVAPHTLIILLDEGHAWPGAFSFHHAVQYLYGRRAAGAVPGRADTMYTVSSEGDGVHVEPWASVRVAWDAPRSTYTYDQVVIVRSSGEGTVEVVQSWPSEFDPLPAGVTYAPLSRIRPGASAPARILPGI